MSELIERAKKLLTECGIHDYGLAGFQCGCSGLDHRPIVSELLDKLDEQQTTLEWAAETIKRLKAECAEYDEANTDLGRALERAKPILGAARAWRGWFPYADSMFAPENALIAAVDALDACSICGPGGCAGHTRKLSVAGACVCSSTNHDYNGTTVRELNPDADCPVHGEVFCPRCGGRDGTHTVRNCEKDMAGCGRHECPWLGYHCHGDSHGYCCVEGIYLVQPDGVAVHRDHLVADDSARYPNAQCGDWMPHQTHVWGDPKHWCAGLSSTDTTGGES